MASGDGDLESATQKLYLSTVERKWIKIGKMKGLMEGTEDWQVVGKSLPPKPISIEGIHQTLGRIWCSDKGLVIKDVGENKFLFSFNHPMGKKRALEDGSWMMGHSLLIMVPYNGKMSLEAMDFHHAPRFEFQNYPWG
jgi:hypothetical protein